MSFRLRGVRAGYAGVPVLDGIDLTVPDRSVVALLGVNGAGKTTLLRAASGLIPLTEGTLEHDGDDVTGLRVEDLARRGICHVPEGRGVFPNLTVAHNLLLFAKPGRHDEALKRAVDAFPRLGERLTQLAGTMSGGEQQMLALARAYVQSPKVVLLDEVSMGLAPKIVDEIFAFLERLAAEGASLLLVEQYVERALAVADVVYLIDHGRVAFCGEPQELANRDVFAEYVGAGFVS
ncbi:ABC transporter ATP-binding protein [Sporichthya brevicatena]|uniref:ABC transporter ATP-binding protein n=1 Tax=Sporichthya brevicatena TaxID=171442 RepID=A0ABN1H9M7_9ACTN